MAAYVRRAICREDWCRDACNREIADYEIALAGLMRLQDCLRELDGRDPRKLECPYAGPQLVDKPVTLLSHEDVTGPRGYRGNAGWTNGGMSGFRATRTESTNLQLVERPIFGVAAFSEVVGCGGLPELAWYHSASEFEVGLSTNLDAMIVAALNGRDAAGGSSSAPAGPGVHQIDAATLQREVRVALRSVPLALQAVIETAYEDRCLPTQQVKDYGHGIAPIMARANAAKRAFIASPDGDAIRALSEALQTLAGTRKRASNAWEPLTKQDAVELLRTAHDAYQVARGQKGSPPPRKRKPRRKPHEPAVLMSGKVGALKRRFFEAA